MTSLISRVARDVLSARPPPRRYRSPIFALLISKDVPDEASQPRPGESGAAPGVGGAVSYHQVRDTTLAKLQHYFDVPLPLRHRFSDMCKSPGHQELLRLNWGPPSIYNFDLIEVENVYDM